MKLHINCDMGESYGSFKIGNDFAIMPYVDAVNIACGFHGGDPLTIQKTIVRAIALGKEIGAHPSYPDLVGFGRRYLELSEAELSACLRYQICALQSLVNSFGGKLSHVKAHGALYNRAAKDPREAKVFIEVVKTVDPDCTIFAPYNSEMHLEAIRQGLKVKFESFADRRYTLERRLVDRKLEGAVIDQPQEVCAQVGKLLEGKVVCIEGSEMQMSSDTICLHGDHASVVDSLILIRDTFKT